MTKCAILAKAPPNLFERPLRHLQAASSIARSGPRAKSITRRLGMDGGGFLRRGRHYQREMVAEGGTGRNRGINKRAARV